MVITNLEEKENRKIWVPIRGGNRGGWSLFQWEKVRQMPYRDREMYLGNSAKIGVLDKGGKWRKKDWYLKKNEMSTGQTLTRQQCEAIRKDQERMKAALGMVEKDDQDKLTPAEMQELLKKVRGKKDDYAPVPETDAIGLGFDKMKVQIRAKPTVKSDNPHRLEGNIHQFEENPKKHHQKRQKSLSEQNQKKKSKKVKKEKKEKKQKKHRQRSLQRSRSREQNKKHHKKQRDRSHSRDRKERRHRYSSSD